MLPVLERSFPELGQPKCSRWYGAPSSAGWSPTRCIHLMPAAPSCRVEFTQTAFLPRSYAGAEGAISGHRSLDDLYLIRISFDSWPAAGIRGENDPPWHHRISIGLKS